MQRAGFGIRLVASLVDAAMLAAVVVGGVAVIAVVAAVMPPAADYDQAVRLSRLYLAAVTSFVFVLAVLYTAMDVFRGATVGKRLFHLRVGLAGPAGPAAGAPWPRLLLRWALKYFPVTATLLARATGFTLMYFDFDERPAGERAMVAMTVLTAVAVPVWGLILLGGFFFALGPRRQALHDMLARTVVLRPDQGPHGFAPVMLPPAAGYETHATPGRN